ncbi:hypothetical protein CYMTET_30737 [Cymbomonas tetramitiformis]|uniref:Uncharacterized protein n=1 Tax=Cymbomonas tetramitiformis TaxID=36881 RepID=A0AAE0KTM1_9CHLO|nr:hypothetical protein CYMTET_30737 [Cymbomonas tetramitiformis]
MEALTNNASFFTVSWKSEGLYFKISSMVALLEKLESFQAFEQRKLRDFAEEWAYSKWQAFQMEFQVAGDCLEENTRPYD